MGFNVNSLTRFFSYQEPAYLCSDTDINRFRNMHKFTSTSFRHCDGSAIRLTGRPSIEPPNPPLSICRSYFMLVPYFG